MQKDENSKGEQSEHEIPAVECSYKDVYSNNVLKYKFEGTCTLCEYFHS